MNSLGRILLIVGAIVLALLIGVLVGRRQHPVEPLQGNAQSMQITTTPPAAIPAPTPLPATVPPPVAPPPLRVAPDAQVQDDAAAVGMTTREDAGTGAQADTAAPHSADGAPPASDPPN
jgi:hypothetical protein